MNSDYKPKTKLLWPTLLRCRSLQKLLM